MNYNEVHNRLHVDRFRFRAKTTPFSTRLNANKLGVDGKAHREDWDNPMTAGALARWILWDKETLPSSIEDYTRRFNLAAV